MYRKTFCVNEEPICHCLFILSIVFRQAVTIILTLCQWDTSLRGNVASVIVRTYFMTSNSVQSTFNFSRSVPVSCCMIVQDVWLWLIQWMKLIECAYRKPLSENIQFNGWIFTAYRARWWILPLLVTTGSDRKPVWLLLEATSSNRIKKNVKTAQLFLYGKALQKAFEVSAFSCPKPWPLFVSLLYIETADSGFPFNLDKGVIKLLWVMSVCVWSFSAQLTVGSLRSSDRVKIIASNHKKMCMLRIKVIKKWEFSFQM